MLRRILCLSVLFFVVVCAHAVVGRSNGEKNDMYSHGPFSAEYTTYSSMVYEPFSFSAPMQYNSSGMLESDGQWQFPPIDPAEPGILPSAALDDLPVACLTLCVLLYVRMKCPRN